MSKCCSKTNDLGCIDSCDTFTIGTTSEDGVYTLNFDPGTGIVAQDTVTIAGGADLTYDLSNDTLDVGYSYIISVTDPSGNEYTQTIDSVVYDCFKIEIQKVISV